MIVCSDLELASHPAMNALIYSTANSAAMMGWKATPWGLDLTCRICERMSVEEGTQNATATRLIDAVPASAH